jgi:hypothetical protein
MVTIGGDLAQEETDSAILGAFFSFDSEEHKGLVHLSLRDEVEGLIQVAPLAVFLLRPVALCFDRGRPWGFLKGD